jgi:hypothetical protein
MSVNLVPNSEHYTVSMVGKEWAAIAIASTVELLIRGVGQALYSETRSLACKSSALTHKSWAGEYPFHLMRYCFFFLLR